MFMSCLLVFGKETRRSIKAIKNVKRDRGLPNPKLPARPWLLERGFATPDIFRDGNKCC
jgi:hypothetical protein